MYPEVSGEPASARHWPVGSARCAVCRRRSSGDRLLLARGQYRTQHEQKQGGTHGLPDLIEPLNKVPAGRLGLRASGPILRFLALAEVGCYDVDAVRPDAAREVR